MTSTALAAAVLAVVVGASGVVLLVARRAAATGVLLVAAAAGAVPLVASDGAPDDRLLAVVALVILPAAVLTFPRWRWRHPVGYVTSVVTLGSGALAVLNDGPEVEAIAFVGLLALGVHLWWMVETTTGDDRIAVSWLAATLGAVGLATGLLGFALDGSDSGSAFLTIAALLAVPVAPAAVIGALRPHVLDVRGVVVRGVVVAVAVVVQVSLFAGVVSVIELTEPGDLSPGTLGLVAAGVAVVFHPTVVVLRGVVDQLLFGDRPDPLRAAARVVDRVGDDPVVALRAIREALVLPYASVRVDGVELGSSGTEVTHTRTVSLRLGDEIVGEVVVGLRPGDLGLTAADERVLRIVAPLLAQTLRSRSLALEVAASRAAAITSIEEERRRLRRDLHDGLGPTLTGVAFTADAARNTVVSDPVEAGVLLAALRADVADAIVEVRRLVEGLRPPVLDQLGLAAALRQVAASVRGRDGSPVSVEVVVEEVTPGAAVEVAAYRIAVEALTNVARHSGARHAWVDLRRRSGELRLTVTDDGGDGPEWVPGVGLSSMRERAEQVGGTVTVRHGPHGGIVTAVLPDPDGQPA